ncbi:hypothetical protein A1O3_09810 [Capronia epimyces CBS 606.96]|uniref:Uncharacterized protein n=1 Tax=Capronia epimyces CBS 606.96 TaxID=1182542 RepID=W9XBI6_9EURO|nr:uncharacterized protein A1O3_09810 [Capronia epimyces CBS 606.96]EXJ77583.1 hypothetical protein A1O3_09810 [Capronia epimyces CBS 606.96]
MALAAIHRTSLMSPADCQFNDDARRLITNLTAACIQHLRKELQDPDDAQLGAQLATTRTLFLCEAISGSPTPRAWRTHFMGARALLTSSERSGGKALSSQRRDTSISFLKRWFNITEGLVALTTEGLSGGQATGFGPRGVVSMKEGNQVCLDVYTGCTEDLCVAFREIGAVAWEKRRAIDHPERYPRLSEDDFLREADMLELSVRRMIERDRSRSTVLNVTGAHDISPEQAEEFFLCNEAYQHTALIHVHRRIRGLPVHDPLVQESVRRIIECVSSIRPAATLSPLTLLTTPLFAAGCAALGTERIKIAQILTNMFALLRLPNMKRALEVLEAFWNDSEAREIDWDEFSRTCTSDYAVWNQVDDNIGQRDWDFLPY